MTEKIENCWEYTGCGREPGGSKAKELGVCPAATEERYDGTNKGKNAGRFCWAVAGTLCNDKATGTFAKKLATCLQCEFYLKVEREEGRQLKLTP